MTAETHFDSGEIKTGVLRWVIKNVLYVFISGLVLFLTAGRWDWTWGWAYLGLLTGVQVLTGLLLIPSHPDLIAERSQMQSGTKSWDPPLASILALFGPLGMLIVSALDMRFSWTAEMPLWVHLAGLSLALLGALFTLWAMVANRFFASTVRIQTERGHTVVSRGPYRWVRHPGYAGALAFSLGTPLLFASVWAFVPAAAILAATVVRTALEDRTLKDELPGYREYAGRVRWRLLPGIW